MSDTTSRGDDDVLGGGFDQTNDQVSGLQGESGGTADGEVSSAADREDGGGAGADGGGDLLDGLHEGGDGRNDPEFGVNTPGGNP